MVCSLHPYRVIVSTLDRFPEQRLTRIEALRGQSLLFTQLIKYLHQLVGMTIDPAYASFTESSLGSLESGKRADFAVLDQDIMAIPTKEILSTKVLATAMDGEIVYGKI